MSKSLIPQAMVAAILAGVTAVASALGAARVVARRAQRNSHQVATAQSWIELEPRPTREQLERGRRVFLNNCAHCHGIDARGDEGPDLHEIQVSDRYIARTIIGGIRGEMPSFAKKLGAAEIGDVTQYLRSL